MKESRRLTVFTSKLCTQTVDFSDLENQSAKRTFSLTMAEGMAHSFFSNPFTYFLIHSANLDAGQTLVVNAPTPEQCCFTQSRSTLLLLPMSALLSKVWHTNLLIWHIFKLFSYRNWCWIVHENWPHRIDGRRSRKHWLNWKLRRLHKRSRSIFDGVKTSLIIKTPSRNLSADKIIINTFWNWRILIPFIIRVSLSSVITLRV